MYNWNLLLNEELFHNIHYQMKEYHLHLHIPLRIHLDYAYILLNLEVQRIVNSVEHFYGFLVHSVPPVSVSFVLLGSFHSAASS